MIGTVPSISVFIKGHEELKKKYFARGVAAGNLTKKELNMIGRELVASATKFIKRQTGSRSETRYGPTRNVTVSNPGAYPNDDLGGLVKGLKYTVKRNNKGKSTLSFQSRAPYALDLEFGTRNMRARPYMGPTLKRNRKDIVKRLGRSVKRAL